MDWLSHWYTSQCDGDWEHGYGITIETLDNPGWSITVDIDLLPVGDLEPIPWQYFENNENDWYGFKAEDDKFEASGDPTKLSFIISLFKDFVEGKQIG